MGMALNENDDSAEADNEGTGDYDSTEHNDEGRLVFLP